MSEINVDWTQMFACADQIKGCQTMLQQCINQINSTKRQLQWQIRMQMDITSSLNRSIDRVRTLGNGVNNLSSVLSNAAHKYRMAELFNGLSSVAAVAPFLFDWTGSEKCIGGLFPSSGDGSFGGGFGGGGFRDGTSDKLWEGTLISGGGMIVGTLFGYNASASGEYSILHGEVDSFSKAKMDIYNGDINAAAGFKADGHVLGGSTEQTIGDLHNTLEGKVLTGSVSGSVEASLMKDGQLAPSLQAKLKAEGSVLHGEDTMRYGSEENNLHLHGEGDVLHGEAEGSIGIGKLTHVNQDGTVNTAYGAEAKVSAEGYALSGEVSGGFTLFGIKFDATLEGNAFGAGVEAGASLTTNSASGKIGAGLIFGAGVEFSVDWSDFKMPDWDSIFPW